MRDLSHLLHPALLDDLGPARGDRVVPAGLRQAPRHPRRAAPRPHGRAAAPEIEAAAYRIVQEALTNVAKHARATDLPRVPQRLPNTVLDHHRRRRRRASTRWTRRGRRRRAASAWSASASASTQLRGTVRLESAPGKGTRLTVELPARARGAVGDATGPSSRSQPMTEPVA